MTHWAEKHTCPKKLNISQTAVKTTVETKNDPEKRKKKIERKLMGDCITIDEVSL